jgi:transcriptional regulator with GAF, ATPase, and Fis domain
LSPDTPQAVRRALNLVGVSRDLERVLGLCERVARSSSTVLISGETGTGKELLARYIHKLSVRRDHPIVVFHCGACPETLIESELFGHERGAFTGATQPRIGHFERANGGALLLDEVGDISLAAQAKLLRVLQERQFSRIGGTAVHASDARIIATTHHDLLALARKGRFREDLFFRLNVLPIHVPPLRDRREDIAVLTRHFIEALARQSRKRQSGIHDEALAAMVSYRWPGNVRELCSAIERAMLLSEGDVIQLKHLPPEVIGGFVSPHDGETTRSFAYSQRLMTSRALHEAHWELPRAAQALGVSVHSLRQMIARFGLKRD